MTVNMLFYLLLLLVTTPFCVAQGDENEVCIRMSGISVKGSGGGRGPQGPPGKTGQKGIKGSIGPRGEKGIHGVDASIDYDHVDALIKESVEEGFSEVRESVNEFKQNVQNKLDQQESKLDEFGSKLSNLSNQLSEISRAFDSTSSVLQELYERPVIVGHNISGEVEIVDGCDPRGCFSVIPRYQLDQDAIVKIINRSRECRQFIKLRCKGVSLLRDGGYGWWVSRDGEKMSYWGGATSRRGGYCACGETNSCLDNSYHCNCDQNSGSITTQDEGYITDKSKLPVRELRFGDMGASVETGWYTLGSLECWGKA